MRALLALLLIAASLLPARGEARRRRRRAMPATGPAAEAFAEGTQRFKARDYLGAIEAYEKAYRLKPHYIVQCNIARCHERTNDMIKAAEHFARCLKEGAGRQRVGRKVRRSLRRVKARISRVEVRSPGKGGVVYLDGEQIGEAPQTFKVNPGRRIIEVRREGATPASTTIRTRGGEYRTLELVPIARPGAPAPKVALPAIKPKPAPRRPAAISPVVTERPRSRSEARAGVSQGWFWTTAALTVGLAAAATAVGVTALNLKTDYEEDPTRAGYNEAKDRRLLANLLFGGTLLAGAGTTLLFFFTDFGGGGGEADGDDEARLTVGVGVGGVW